MIDSTYEDKCYRTPTFAGAVRCNVPKSCATLLCRACEDFPVCVAVRYLTLRIGYERHGRKNPLPYPFSQRSHVGNLRQIRKQGKGRSSKRKGNRRCPFLFAPAAGRGTSPPSADGESPAEVQRKTPRPSGANTLTQFVCPGFPVQKRSRPVRANTLTQFAHPGQPVQQKSAAQTERTACAVRVSRLTLRSYLTILRRQSMLSQQQNRRKYEPVHPCTLRSVPRH